MKPLCHKLMSPHIFLSLIARLPDSPPFAPAFLPRAALHAHGDEFFFRIWRYHTGRI